MDYSNKLIECFYSFIIESYDFNYEDLEEKDKFVKT